MTDSKRHFSWPVWVGDGLLLLCALMGFTGSFLSLYSDPDAVQRIASAPWLQATVLDRCAVNGDLFLACAALFGLTTLCAWSLPRFWSAAAGGLTALWAAGVLWNQAEVAQGAGITVRDVTTLFASRVPWGLEFPYDTELSSVEEAAAAQLFLLFTLAGLALLLGWAVVRSRRWWVAVLLTLPPLLPGLAADLYPDWLPFMALAACWCAMLLTSLCRWAAPSSRGKLTMIALPTAALALALITAIFPREGYTRPAWAQRAQDSLLNFTSRLSGYFPSWNSGPFQSTVTYVGAMEEVDLAHAGPLNYTGRAVLRVTSDYDGWMFLRGSSLAVYENGVWKALPDGTYSSYWTGQGLEVEPLYLPSALGYGGNVYTITVDNIGAVGTCVYTPYFPLSQDVNESGMLPVEDAYFARRQGQWSHTITFADRSYAAPGTLATAVPDGGFLLHDAVDALPDENFFLYNTMVSPAQSAVAAYTKYVYDNYLDVPADLRGTLTRYAGSYPFGYFHPVLMAEWFGEYLGTFCEYDARTPAAPEGVDPVYYFLTESHRGYCMHFASAVTLMLRAVGIPARYVNGFKAEIFPNQQTRVLDRAAHAWVEVWVDGFGWYPVEVTPADAFNWAGQSGDDPIQNTPEPTVPPLPTRSPLPTETPAPTATPAPTDAPDRPTTAPPEGISVDGPGSGASGPDFTALLNGLKWTIPIFAIAFMIWFVQFAVKRLRTGRMSGPDANRSALVCYHYLCRLGRWGGRLHPQAEELAQKARFSQHTLTGDELSLMRYLVDRERARLCIVSRPPVRLAFRYWWGQPQMSVPPPGIAPPQEE